VLHIDRDCRDKNSLKLPEGKYLKKIKGVVVGKSVLIALFCLYDSSD
jgi:hypothetical protein